MYTKSEILQLTNITTKFYSKVSSSFSNTRKRPWEGWVKCKEYINTHKPKSILDVACGNMRFEKYINFKGKIYLIDNNSKLAQIGDKSLTNYYNIDIIKSLILNSLPNIINDTTVCFGFLHHIPDFNLRLKFINWMLNNSGVLIISLWQFHKNNKLLQKAKKATSIAQTKLDITLKDDNDYFLSWQNNLNVFRFCHSFEDSEVESLTNNLNANIDLVYTADNCNKYLILKKL